jgi:diphthamide synthase subunit DPH2
VSQEFYQQFLLLLLQEVLYVMTDRLHKSGIKVRLLSPQLLAFDPCRPAPELS